MRKTLTEQRCKGVNRRGEPCGRKATYNGFCVVHAGKQNMKATGQLGGRGRTRSVLGVKPEYATDELRAKAQQRMNELLDDPDPRIRGMAARAVVSYSPQRPPAEHPVSGEPRTLKGGRRVTGLVDMLEFMLELPERGGSDVLLEPRLADMIERCHAHIHASEVPGPPAVDEPPDAWSQ